MEAAANTEASVATTSGTAAPSGADEQCPPWAMELRGQLDTLQQSTVLAQQEARAAREDSRRSDMLLGELQRRVDGLRHVPAANGGLSASLGATSGLAAGLVGSLWGASKGAVGGGAALGASGDGSASISAAASTSAGDSMAIGGLHAMMDAHFKQMEELWQEVAGMRETTDARLKEVTLTLTPHPISSLPLTRGSKDVTASRGRTVCACAPCVHAMRTVHRFGASR